MSLLSLLGISDAKAAVTTSSQQGGLVSILPMLIAFVAIFYFLLIRPQSKRAKQHRDLVSGLKLGDEIITTGGILGKIAKLDDDLIVITVAEGVNITIQKSAVALALPNGTLKSIN